MTSILLQAGGENFVESHHENLPGTKPEDLVDPNTIANQDCSTDVAVKEMHQGSMQKFAKKCSCPHSVKKNAKQHESQPHESQLPMILSISLTNTGAIWLMTPLDPDLESVPFCVITWGRER